MWSAIRLHIMFLAVLAGRELLLAIVFVVDIEMKFVICFLIAGIYAFIYLWTHFLR